MSKKEAASQSLEMRWYLCKCPSLQIEGKRVQSIHILFLERLPTWHTVFPDPIIKSTKQNAKGGQLVDEYQVRAEQKRSRGPFVLIQFFNSNSLAPLRSIGRLVNIMVRLRVSRNVVERA
jgi:hypothetical protein